MLLSLYLKKPIFWKPFYLTTKHILKEPPYGRPNFWKTSFAVGSKQLKSV